MKNEKLMRSIGEIDEDLIAEAHETTKPRARWIRWSAMAAGFALLVACVPLLMLTLGGSLAFDAAAPEMEMVADADHYYSGAGASSVTVQGEVNGNLTWADEKDSSKIEEILDALQKGENGEILPTDEAMPETEAAGNTEQVYHVGDTAREAGLAVQYLAADETAMKLHIKKNDNTPLTISVTVISRDGETESAWIVHSKRDVESFGFTVNGEKSDVLPTEAGAYDITVDFSALLKGGDRRLSERVVINDTLVLILR